MATFDTNKKLIIQRGVSVLLPFVYRQNGVVYDLTGKPVTFHLIKRTGTDSTNEILTLVTGADANSLGSILTFTDATNGAFHLKISDEQTAKFTLSTVGTWSFTYESGGNDYLIYSGNFKVVSL